MGKVWWGGVARVCGCDREAKELGGKGFTALLGGDQFMGIQSKQARYSLNASSGGMQWHQLECVSR